MADSTKPSHYKWEDIPSKILSKYVTQQIVPGDQMMLSQLSLLKNAVVQKHAHPNEQFTCILKGSLLFRFGEQDEHEVVVSAGEVLHIPANVPHSAFALEDTLDLDIFTPPRSDWLRIGGEDYFKNS
jgi:quercetin dioxygenase-like cupin family protein